MRLLAMLSLLLIAALPARAGTAPGAGSLGYFVSEDGGTKVELYRCGPEELCGRIAWLRRAQEADGSPRLDLFNPDPDLRDRELIGMKVLWGLEPRGGNRWRKGRIYNPDDGESYRAAVEIVSQDEVELRACLLVLCETQDWQRVERPETAPR